VETSKQRLRRAMGIPDLPDDSRRSQTDTTNDQAQPRSGYQAGGGVKMAATGLPHLQSIPPTVESKGKHQPVSSESSSSLVRWAEIKKRAETKRRESQAAKQSDEGTQDEETIESRVARIKARVAELTGKVESDNPSSTERSQERPLTLQIRRQTAGNITNSWKPLPALSRIISDIGTIGIRDALYEPDVNDTVLASTRTSSANGNDLTRIEQDPFCRPWYSGSILDRILTEMGVESVRSDLISLGVTDLWLPLSKQLLRRSLRDRQHDSELLRLQDEHLRGFLARWTRLDTINGLTDMLFGHCEFEDDEVVFEEKRLLGEGLVGLVEEVTVRYSGPSFICVRKKIARPKQLKAHNHIMAAFIREVKVMRQVDHRHCVRFLGSYTDTESVNILSTPVADMDLAAFLDKPIGDSEWSILYKGIDCLCNGL
jgi:hypothetical protein